METPKQTTPASQPMSRRQREVQEFPEQESARSDDWWSEEDNAWCLCHVTIDGGRWLHRTGRCRQVNGQRSRGKKDWRRDDRCERVCPVKATRSWYNKISKKLIIPTECRSKNQLSKNNTRNGMYCHKYYLHSTRSRNKPSIKVKSWEIKSLEITWFCQFCTLWWDRANMLISLWNTFYRNI